MSAYEIGWDAAERGHLMVACPYRSGTGAAIAWRQGWKAFHHAWKDNA